MSVRSNTTFPVTTLAGEAIELQDVSEQRYYDQAQRKYRSENQFDQASDLRALDRLIFLETVMHRYQKHLASGRDYDGILAPAQEEILRKSIREIGPMISSVQTDLGLTKNQREKDQHESVGSYITKLTQAAKVHGVRREKQLTKALDLMNQLFSMVGSYQRSSEAERSKLGLESADEILDWVQNFMRPEYDSVDNYFREHEQKFFIGQL